MERKEKKNFVIYEMIWLKREIYLYVDLKIQKNNTLHMSFNMADNSLGLELIDKNLSLCLCFLI